MIDYADEQDVADIMKESILFLSLGHPQGLGLPIAEAIASRFAVAGYSGLRGLELFRIGKKYGTCLEIAVGDWVVFIQAVKALDSALEMSSEEVLKRLAEASSEVRTLYSKIQRYQALPTHYRG